MNLYQTKKFGIGRFQSNSDYDWYIGVLMQGVKTIAIDGPAGSGKSTLGRNLAKCFGYMFFDTGIMYRAVTFIAIARSLNLNNEQEIAYLGNNIQIDVLPPSELDGRDNDIIVEGVDVTWSIRKPLVDDHVSVLSTYPNLRKALTAQQRRIGLRGEVVMVGRDIGTVVLPEAEFKIFLDASIEERAGRRYRERISRGEQIEYDEVLESLNQRDQIDTTRSVAPLKPAEDAIIINTDELDASEVLNLIKTILSTGHNHND